jgi:hypothetical protein
MTTFSNFLKQNRAATPWTAWKSFAFPVLQWAGLALGLHLLWEIGQLPFYVQWSEADAWRIALYVAHCTLGDVLIATLAYLAVALAWRRANWPRHRPRSGGALLVALGLGYTVFSEWYNVYRLGSWAYAEAMPQVLGIGLTPLLQWLIVPVAMLALVPRKSPGNVLLVSSQFTDEGGQS